MHMTRDQLAPLDTFVALCAGHPETEAHQARCAGPQCCLDSVKSPANVVGRRTYSRRRGSVCPMDEGADYNVAIELHPNLTEQRVGRSPLASLFFCGRPDFEFVHLQSTTAHFLYARANTLRDRYPAEARFNIGQTTDIRANCPSTFFQFRNQGFR